MVIMDTVDIFCLFVDTMDAITRCGLIRSFKAARGRRFKPSHPDWIRLLLRTPFCIGGSFAVFFNISILW